MDGTKETLDAVEKGLASVNDEVLRASGANPGSSRAESTEETHDRFRDVMVPFAERAEKDVARARALAASARDAMKSATEFFGEPFKPDNGGRIFKLVADKVLEQDQERDAVAGVESELLFVGAKNSGKSTLIHSFLSKEEAPKPTSALEYRFSRRSTGEDKAVANIWELGGGSQLRCAGCCSIPLCCPCTARLAPTSASRPACCRWGGTSPLLVALHGP